MNIFDVLVKNFMYILLHNYCLQLIHIICGVTSLLIEAHLVQLESQ
jgi:hypothetical protein